jgi:hypothetical protein
VHATFFGVGAKGRFSRISCVHAAPRLGSVPAAGVQRSVYSFLPGCPIPFGQMVMCSDVLARRIAAMRLIDRG